MALSANRSTIPVLTLEEARRLIPNGRSVGTIQPLIANGEAPSSATGCSSRWASQTQTMTPMS